MFKANIKTLKQRARPKIGNWETHQGKHGKYPKKTGETIGET